MLRHAFVFRRQQRFGYDRCDDRIAGRSGIIAPQKVIFLEDKLPWVTLDESLPSFPKTPKTKANQGRHRCHGFRMGGSACPQDDAHSPKAKIKIRRLPAASSGNALRTTRSTKKR